MYNKPGKDDYIAGLLRSQIGASQNMLYCLENNLLDSEYLKDGLKKLEKGQRQIVNLFAQIDNKSEAFSLN